MAAGITIFGGFYATRALTAIGRSSAARRIAGKPAYDVPQTAATKLTASTFRGLPYPGNFKEPMDASEVFICFLFFLFFFLFFLVVSFVNSIAKFRLTNTQNRNIVLTKKNKQK